MEFTHGAKQGKHGWLDMMVQVWHPGNDKPADGGVGSGVGHDLLDSFFHCAEHLRDGFEVARGEAWAAMHPKEAEKYRERMKHGKGLNGYGSHHQHGDHLPPLEQRYMFIVATDAPQTAVERMTRRLQHRTTDQVSVFGPEVRGLEAHVAAAMEGEVDTWWAERLMQFFVFARCRHSIVTRNSQDIRVAVETGGLWRHRGEKPTISEVALNYRVNATTGVWHNFSLGIRGECARGMWRHYQARYPEI